MISWSGLATSSRRTALTTVRSSQACLERAELPLEAQSRWPPAQNDRHSNRQVHGPPQEQRPEAPRMRERRGEPFHGNEDRCHNRHLGR